MCVSYLHLPCDIPPLCFLFNDFFFFSFLFSSLSSSVLLLFAFYFTPSYFCAIVVSIYNEHHCHITITPSPFPRGRRVPVAERGAEEGRRGQRLRVCGDAGGRETHPDGGSLCHWVGYLSHCYQYDNYGKSHPSLTERLISGTEVSWSTLLFLCLLPYMQ